MTPAAGDYRYGLALTSQFYFCGLPLRLDIEPGCQFTCLYCFAKARGGAQRTIGRPPQLTSASSLRRRLERIASGHCSSVIDQMLARGIPLHLGGMTDPFGFAAPARAVALEVLNVLADYRQPTVISTKGLAASLHEYLEVLIRGRFLVQFSLSTMDDLLANQIEIGAPSPTSRLNAMRELAAAGVPVTGRIQPLLPGHTSDAVDLIHALAENGARHVGIEHLKLPLENRFKGTEHLSRYLGKDLRSLYASLGATRVGREYVLPVEERLPRILAMREIAHGRGLRFGAADTDLLLLSDGGCCCSGVDLSGFSEYHRYTYLEAVRRSGPDEIRHEILSDVWYPDGPLSQYVNSHSRLHRADDENVTIADYISHNWNGRANGPSPSMLWGIEDTGDLDLDGYRVYGIQPEAREILEAETSWVGAHPDPGIAQQGYD